MYIKNLIVKNFKSFEDVNIELSDFNIIIGPNAAGKSNFISVFKFINDIQEYGFDNAISLQGGIKYLYNSRITSKEPIEIKFVSQVDHYKKLRIEKYYDEFDVIIPEDFSYCLTIVPQKRSDRYKYIEEELIINFYQSVKSRKEQKMCSIKIIKDKNGKIQPQYSLNITKKTKKKLEMMNMLSLFEERDYSLLLMMNYLFMPFGMYRDIMKFYDFNVNLLKSPSSIATKLHLKEDGSNLVNVIQQILKNKNEKQRLNRIVRSIFPFIEDIQIENSINKSLIFKVREKYTNQEYPSHLLSDGTVNVLALIVALYFQNHHEFIVIEEPERNIHPMLLDNITQLLKEVSEKKQIIITTHNPYILKNMDLKNVYFISRDQDGYSKVTKPIDNKNINIFLANELGIDELFVEDLLSE